MSAHEKVGLARREFIKNSSLLIACQIAGQILHVSPAQAAQQAAPMRFLTAAEANTLRFFAEVMVPGATTAGVVHFVDSQLAGDPDESLLIVRYFGVKPPHGDFYRAGLAALDAAARTKHKAAYSELQPAQALEMAASLFKAPPPGWKGPPAPLFYTCVRSDAVDVVYGTPAGFESLGIPYMQHILPPRSW